MFSVILFRVSAGFDVGRFLKRIGTLASWPRPDRSPSTTRMPPWITHGVYVCRAHEYAYLSSDRWRLLSMFGTPPPPHTAWGRLRGWGWGRGSDEWKRRRREVEEMPPPSNLPPAVTLHRRERTRNSGIRTHVKTHGIHRGIHHVL